MTKTKLFNEANRTRGFTLIELLIVVAVIAILAGLLFVTLKPLQRFQDARNAQRWADVNALLSAIKLDQVDNGGTYYTAIANMTDNTYYQIGDASIGCDTSCLNPTYDLQSACVDIYDLIDEGYLAELPLEPNNADAIEDHIGYYLYKYNSGQICVGACAEEQGSNSSAPTIEACR